jgi:hypothetical protein
MLLSSRAARRGGCARVEGMSSVANATLEELSGMIMLDALWYGYCVRVLMC